MHTPYISTCAVDSNVAESLMFCTMSVELLAYKSCKQKPLRHYVHKQPRLAMQAGTDLSM